MIGADQGASGPGGRATRTASLDSRQLSELIGQVQHGRRRRRRRELLATALTPTVFLIAVVLLWELVVRLLEMPNYLLPPPSLIIATAAEQPGLFLEHTLTTLYEIAVGFAAATIIGISLGIAIALSRVASLTVSPIIVAAQAVPTIAVAPLLLIWFGFGLLPKVIMVAVAAFFPIVVNTVAGITSLQPEKKDLGRILGLKPTAFFRKVTFPHALPSILSGLKVGVTLAVIGAVVAEFIAANSGLGYLLLAFETNLNTAGVFVTTFLLMAVGLGLYALVALFEALAIPWHVSKRKG